MEAGHLGEYKGIACNSRRVCAIRLIRHCYRMLFINVYLPVEDGNVHFDEFCLQLSLIENLIACHPDDMIVWRGDFNIDFTRLSAHTSLLVEFCVRVDLYAVDKHAGYDVDYTYQFCMQRFSRLDNFVVCGALFAFGC